jgi:hypothetical protein
VQDLEQGLRRSSTIIVGCTKCRLREEGISRDLQQSAPPHWASIRDDRDNLSMELWLSSSQSKDKLYFFMCRYRWVQEKAERTDSLSRPTGPHACSSLGCHATYSHSCQWRAQNVMHVGGDCGAVGGAIGSTRRPASMADKKADRLGIVFQVLRSIIHSGVSLNYPFFSHQLSRHRSRDPP